MSNDGDNQKQRSFEGWCLWFRRHWVLKVAIDERRGLDWVDKRILDPLMNPMKDVWASIAKAKIAKRKVKYDVERKTVTIVS